MFENLYFKKFIQLTAKLSTIEFIGLTQIFCVDTVMKEVDSNGRPIGRDFVDIYEDVLDGFLKLNNKQKKEILKVLSQSSKLEKDNTLDKLKEKTT